MQVDVEASAVAMTADLLRAARMLLRLSQSELAAVSGLSLGIVSKFERRDLMGETVLSERSRRQVAEALAGMHCQLSLEPYGVFLVPEETGSE